jgi:hypothetical protein
MGPRRVLPMRKAGLGQLLSGGIAPVGRSGMEHYKQEQFNRVAAMTFPYDTVHYAERQANSDLAEKDAIRKIYRSNIYRRAGLICFGISLLAFVFGCGWGAMTVATAKTKTEIATPKSG